MSKAESADLIIKLYDLRREATMREARSWMIGFFPETAQDVLKVMIDAETSAYYRMVMTYWDMAASFVNHDAIDEDMFNDSASEHIVFFAKIEPFLTELREMTGNPNMFGNLEKLIMRQPDARERLAKSRETMKRWMQLRAESAKV